MVWQSRNLIMGKVITLVAPIQLLFFGLGWTLLTSLPLALLSTSYGIDSRVVYASAFGYALVAGATVWAIGQLIVLRKVGQFGPLAIAVLACLWLVFTPLSIASFRNQTAYAPYSDRTLQYDLWILHHPDWVSRIPASQVTFLQQKLEQAGEISGDR